jgi:hypothetical protein
LFSGFLPAFPNAHPILPLASSLYDSLSFQINGGDREDIATNHLTGLTNNSGLYVTNAAGSDQKFWRGVWLP